MPWIVLIVDFGLGLNTLSSHVSFCLPPLSTLSFLSSLFHLSCLNFPPSFASFCIHKSFFHSCQLSPSFSPLSLSLVQGQRHEESAGFPAEEEWIPRKQPSQQVRQSYEVSQVSGHFLTACACGWAWGCFPGLATTGDDLALEGRHVGSSSDGSVLVMCGINKRNERMFV